MGPQARRDVEDRLAKAALICTGNGAQLTELRRNVLQLILEAPGPLTAYQLLDRLKDVRKSAVPPTVYRSVDFLVAQGLIHKIERLNAFIPCIDSDHHHHEVQFLICRKCGTVAEIEDAAISKALRNAAARNGFAPDHAMVELDGLCSLCAAG